MFFQRFFSLKFIFQLYQKLFLVFFSLVFTHLSCQEIEISALEHFLQNTFYKQTLSNYLCTEDLINLSSTCTKIHLLFVPPEGLKPYGNAAFQHIQMLNRKFNTCSLTPIQKKEIVQVSPFIRYIQTLIGQLPQQYSDFDTHTSRTIENLYNSIGFYRKALEKDHFPHCCLVTCPMQRSILAFDKAIDIDIFQIQEFLDDAFNQTRMNVPDQCCHTNTLLNSFINEPITKCLELFQEFPCNQRSIYQNAYFQLLSIFPFKKSRKNLSLRNNEIEIVDLTWDINEPVLTAFLNLYKDSNFLAFYKNAKTSYLKQIHAESANQKNTAENLAEIYEKNSIDCSVFVQNFYASQISQLLGSALIKAPNPFENYWEKSSVLPQLDLLYRMNIAGLLNNSFPLLPQPQQSMLSAQKLLWALTLTSFVILIPLLNTFFR